ncbi:MAG TPA: hypothetical protein C5S51_10665 [Methanosarcinaceae archaeon]|nr:hypothetical protein [Methanosarcinaceae archaeon]
MGDERWVNYISITLISDNSALSKRKYTKFLTICLVGFIFCIAVSGASANTLEKLDVAEGDAIWYDLTVSEAGLVGINAWTEGISENDDILIYLYDPSGNEVTYKKGYYNQISIAQPVTITGMYKVKVYLEDSYDGGLSKVSVSSPLPMSASPHYIDTTTDVSEGNAIWYDLTVSEAGVVGINAWTEGISENDDILIYLYDPSGNEVIYKMGYYNQISIAQPVTITGTYKVKVYLEDSYDGGLGKVSVSSPISMSASPRYIDTATDVPEGNAIWYDLTVSEAGVVGINAWTEGISENDDILIYLYDPSGTEVTHKKGYYNQISIAQPVTITGTYKVKVYLEDSYDGGLGKVSVSSPLSMSASPRYIDTTTDVHEGNAISYDLTVSEAGVVGINAWTEGISENDDILIYLYD